MRMRGVFLGLGFAFAATALHAASVTVTVDAAKNRRPIKPEIYGVTFATASELLALNIPLNRWGGNSTTLYNWQQKATNFGSDNFFESVPTDMDPDLFISDAQIIGHTEAMITIPEIGWTAALQFGRFKVSSFSVKKYGTQQAVDPNWPDAGNGMKPGKGGPITKNDPLDANMQVDSTFEQGWVQHIVQKSGGARYYILDNEPSLWHVTHRDIHPNGAPMDEVASKMIDTASKIRAADPNGLIVGPEEWGWLGYFYSGMDQQIAPTNHFTIFPDRDAHNGVDYLPYLLSRMRQAEDAQGVRLLNGVSVHYFPQGGETTNTLAAATQQLRNRSTRSLWDPNYTDEALNAKVMLIPRLRAWADAFRAGTPIGITAYNWGVETDMNGATAEADILGIFGREGLDFANLSDSPVRGTPVARVFQLYRNYDGNESTFGDTSVSATVPDPDTLSAFAALRSADRKLTLILINKDLGQPATVDLQLQNFAPAGKAERYQLTFTNSIDRVSDVTLPGTLELPPQSVTLLVVANGNAPRTRAVQP